MASYTKRERTSWRVTVESRADLTQVFDEQSAAQACERAFKAGGLELRVQTRQSLSWRVRGVLPVARAGICGDEPGRTVAIGSAG